MRTNAKNRRFFLRGLAALNIGSFSAIIASKAEGGSAKSSSNIIGRLRRRVDKVAAEPAKEIGRAFYEGGADSNIGQVISSSIKLETLNESKGSGYTNEIDLTSQYVFIENTAGFNRSLDSNDGRSGISAHRVRAIHSGQGDLYAYNGSIVVTAQRSGARHWLANPAGVLFGGTVIGSADGVYLNPFEVFITDTFEGLSYNCAGVGAVYNLSRNKKQGNSLGQVWSGVRVQSVGLEPIENIISATGKFCVGIDLSMPSLDFGDNHAAIAIKANDRIYFNSHAGEKSDQGEMLRENWSMTNGFGEFLEYDSRSECWKVFIKGNAKLSVSPDKTIVDSLVISDALKITGQQARGWKPMTGPEDRSAEISTQTVTLRELAQRVKAIEMVLHEIGGMNSFLVD